MLSVVISNHTEEQIEIASGGLVGHCGIIQEMSGSPGPNPDLGDSHDSRKNDPQTPTPQVLRRPEDFYPGQKLTMAQLQQVTELMETDGKEIEWAKTFQPTPKGDIPLPAHLIKDTLPKKKGTLPASTQYGEVRSSKSYKEHVESLDPRLEKEKLEYVCIGDWLDDQQTQKVRDLLENTGQCLQLTLCPQMFMMDLPSPCPWKKEPYRSSRDPDLLHLQ